MPVHDERHLFEMLTLEGAQAGLSWRTILYKREGYRHAFAGFDAAAVARFTPARVERLLADPSIVRNRLKVESTIANARAVLGLADSGSTLDELVWSFVGGSPTVNRWREQGEVPAETTESKAMSKELKRRGFRFVGSDRLLRVHAGDRSGQRPRDHLLPASRGRVLELIVGHSTPDAFPTRGPRDVRWNASGRSGGRGTRRCRQR